MNPVQCKKLIEEKTILKPITQQKHINVTYFMYDNVG